MKTRTRKSDRSADLYFNLIVNLYPLRPIHNAEQHQQAKKALRSLAGDSRKDVLDYKKVLLGVIETYEREKHLQLDASGISASQVVRQLLDAHHMSVNAFAKQRGMSQSALSDMLNGKREWSKSAIANVAGCFGLNHRLFFQ